MNMCLLAQAAPDAVSAALWFAAWPFFAVWWVLAVVIVVDLVAIFASIASHKGALGLPFLAATAVVLHCGGWVDLIAPFRDHPWITLLTIGIWLALCTAYVLIKIWTRSLKKARGNMSKLTAWLREHGISTGTTVPESLLPEFREWSRYNIHIYSIDDDMWEIPWWFIYAPLDGLYWFWETFLSEFFIYLFTRPFAVAQFERVTDFNLRPWLCYYWDILLVQGAETAKSVDQAP